MAWLRERGEGALADAISTHFTKWGKAETPMARALVACDELTGFVVACCLIRPGGVASLEASSVVKRLKDKSFAAAVDREDVRTSAEELGLEFDEHVAFVIAALNERADELGVAPSGTPA